jgi:hypothetical protein
VRKALLLLVVVSTLCKERSRQFLGNGQIDLNKESLVNLCWLIGESSEC